MPAFPATPVCTIDATGIHAPIFSDLQAWLTQIMQIIYGNDIYLGNDSQDGQLVGILAQAFTDLNSSTVAAYNSFSPSTAQGAGLSSNIKINGLARNIGTNSVCDLTVGGQTGTQIGNGKAEDQAGNFWDLPAAVEIPDAGVIIVTAICETAGVINAPIGTITKIATPTLGWQTVTNAAVATAGTATETDAQLRARQAISTSLPAQTTLDSTIEAVLALPGITRFQAYENDTDTPDGNGIPGHSIALVVEGGDAQSIANAIGLKKCTGCFTFGSTSETYISRFGIPATIRFSRPTAVPIYVSLTITPLAGYSSIIGSEIIAAIVAALNGLPIGQTVYFTRMFNPANLFGAADGLTYDVTALTIGVAPSPVGTTDIDLDFDEVATCVTAHVILTVS